MENLNPETKISAVIIHYCSDTDVENIVRSFSINQVSKNEHISFLEKLKKYSTDAAANFKICYLVD